ncbi:MAG: Na/Pi cotransporter family protein [Candidatus Krumholzibacteriota bacterium]|nr:Na/Pi cotransporter family protein [Candidatus Krumholzibacteriota bacterium]
MAAEVIFQLIGGLGFFLFGIRFMSEALGRVSSNKFKNIVSYLTANRFIAFSVGAGLTALIQSSSAMTVMVIGFINAGLLTLRQAIPVVIGSNIGTTFTAWLVSFFAVFKITHYALPAVGVGFFLMLTCKTGRSRRWGEVLFGFGVLFVGIGFMKEAFAPLQSSVQIKNIMVKFSEYPILGVAVGTAITMLFQSSSATIALVQVLALKGLIGFPATLPLILGDNIGTTLTAQIARIGGNTDSKRIAWVHTLFNVIGTAYMLVLIYLGVYQNFIEWIIPGQVTTGNIMFHIALSHSVFNVFNSVIFLPIVIWLERLVVAIVKEHPDEIHMEPQYLERHLIETPALALEQSRKEIMRMLHLAASGFNDAVDMVMENNYKLAGKVAQKEDAVDNLQAEITKYLIEISVKDLDKDQARMIPVFIHSVNDIERIADQAENIAELIERRPNKGLLFSEFAREELRKMIKVVKGMIEDISGGLEDSELYHAYDALEKEEKLNEMQIDFREKHIKRLKKKSCDILAGLVFTDFVDSLEKIGDHLSNIAKGLQRGFKWK